jgi:hypothetical protein
VPIAKKPLSAGFSDKKSLSDGKIRPGGGRTWSILRRPVLHNAAVAPEAACS